MKWAKALPASLDALQKYVKEHHMTVGGLLKKVSDAYK